MLFFIFGLFLGSFLNNIAFRLEKGEEFPLWRSRCPYCHQNLGWKELIPILSFVLQKGRCLHCQNKISLRYPLIEIVTGFWVYLLSFALKTNLMLISLLEFSFYLIFLSLLFVLALYDLKTYLVDDRLILFGLIVALFFYFLKINFSFFRRDFSFLLNYLFNFGKFEPLFSAFLTSSLFLLIFLLTQGKGLGFGDVKVAFMIGLFLRPGDALLSIILSSFLGSIYGLYLIIKTKKFRQPIPFIPFFFLGVLATILFGNYLSFWYFKIFSL